MNYKALYHQTCAINCMLMTQVNICLNFQILGNLQCGNVMQCGNWGHWINRVHPCGPLKIKFKHNVNAAIKWRSIAPNIL